MKDFVLYGFRTKVKSGSSAYFVNSLRDRDGVPGDVTKSREMPAVAFACMSQSWRSEMDCGAIVFQLVSN